MFWAVYQDKLPLNVYIIWTESFYLIGWLSDDFFVLMIVSGKLLGFAIFILHKFFHVISCVNSKFYLFIHLFGLFGTLYFFFV